MKKFSPADDVKNICKALLHFDETALKRMGVNPEEYKKDISKNMASILVESSGINFSENQIERVRQAILEIFKRSTFETETVYQNENNSAVKVTLGVFKKFTTNEALSNLPPNVAEMSETEKINTVTNLLVDALSSMKIYAYFEFVAECLYDENVNLWIPADAKKFGLTITTKIWDF